MSNPINSDAKIIVVTGGTGALGTAIVQAYLQKGHFVLALARKEGKAGKLSHPTYRFLACDVKVKNEVEGAAAFALAQWGRIDVWINGAGYGKLVPFGTGDEALWKDIFDVNFWGTVHGCRAAVTAFKSPGAAVINIASVAGLMAPKNHSAYATAKAAVIALTRSLAVEYAEKGVRVNAIAPGPLDTEGFRAAGGDPVKRALSIPTRKMILPAEIAAACLFLSEPICSLTGQTLVIDGGSAAAGCYV